MFKLEKGGMEKLRETMSYPICGGPSVGDVWLIES